MAVAALAVPNRFTAALLALMYAGFTAFVVTALRRGGVLSSCGCFGKADTPPTRTHALVALVGFLAWQVMAVLPSVQPAAIRSRTRGCV